MAVACVSSRMEQSRGSLESYNSRRPESAAIEINKPDCKANKVNRIQLEPVCVCLKHLRESLCTCQAQIYHTDTDLETIAANFDGKKTMQVLNAAVEESALDGQKQAVGDGHSSLLVPLCPLHQSSPCRLLVTKSPPVAKTGPTHFSSGGRLRRVHDDLGTGLPSEIRGSSLLFPRAVPRVWTLQSYDLVLLS